MTFLALRDEYCAAIYVGFWAEERKSFSRQWYRRSPWH